MAIRAGNKGVGKAMARVNAKVGLYNPSARPKATGIGRLTRGSQNMRPRATKSAGVGKLNPPGRLDAALMRAGRSTAPVPGRLGSRDGLAGVAAGRSAAAASGASTGTSPGEE